MVIFKTIITLLQNDFKVQLCNYKEEQEDTMSCTETFSGKFIRDWLRMDFNPFMVNRPGHPVSMPRSTGPPRLKSNGIPAVAK